MPEKKMSVAQLHKVVLDVVERMTAKRTTIAMTHKDLVIAIKQAAPGVDGRRAWSALTFVIHLLVLDCMKKLLWRNRFSLKGVHGRGSKRQLEYHPEVCSSCVERVKCMSNETARHYIERRSIHVQQSG